MEEGSVRQQLVGWDEIFEMANAMSDDEEATAETLAGSDDLEIFPTESSDLEILLDPDPADEFDIGSGLALRFDPQYSEETYEELEVLRQNPHRPTWRQRIGESFGPEMTAGVVIGLLIATFALLMLTGVREQPASEQDAPVAPAAEVSTIDIPEVEIGEAATLERE